MENDFDFLGESNSVPKKELSAMQKEKNANATAKVCQLSDVAKLFYGGNMKALDASDMAGGLKICCFKFKQEGDAPAESQALIAVIPPGNKRLIGGMSLVKNGTECEVFNVGWSQYKGSFNERNPAKFNGVDGGIKVESGASFTLGSGSPSGTFKFNSVESVALLVTFLEKIKDGDTLEGYIIYV